jgi:hypothetical protein
MKCGERSPPNSRKDIEPSPSGLPRSGFSLQKLKDFARPFSRDAVIASCFPWLHSGRLRCAPFYNARSLRCAQNLLRCNIAPRTLEGMAPEYPGKRVESKRVIAGVATYRAPDEHSAMDVKPRGKSRAIARSRQSKRNPSTPDHTAANFEAEGEKDSAAAKAKPGEAGDQIRCASPPCYLTDIEE